MGGASPRPPTRELLQGRQRTRSRGHCLKGIQSLEALGPNLSIPFMRATATRDGRLRFGAGRERTRSTWNACGGVSGLRSVDDRQRSARRGAAVAVPPTSRKRVRGAARRSPWPTETESRRLTAACEDLPGGSRRAISSAARAAWRHPYSSMLLRLAQYTAECL